jgi:hypothetical protein
MLGYFEHPFARNIPAAENVLEKRDYVIRLLRSAEADHDQGIV